MRMRGGMGPWVASGAPPESNDHPPIASLLAGVERAVAPFQRPVPRPSRHETSNGGLQDGVRLHRDRQGDEDAGATPRRAVDRDRAAERLGSVLQPDEA